MKYIGITIILTYATTVFACYFFDNSWFMLLLVTIPFMLRMISKRMDKEEGDE